MYDELDYWQVIYVCPDCKDEIYSKFAGQYVGCSCGASALDQTPYYCRVIGKAVIKVPINNAPQTEDEDDDEGFWGFLV